MSLQDLAAGCDGVTDPKAMITVADSVFDKEVLDPKRCERISGGYRVSQKYLVERVMAAGQQQTEEQPKQQTPKRGK